MKDKNTLYLKTDKCITVKNKIIIIGKNCIMVCDENCEVIDVGDKEILVEFK